MIQNIIRVLFSNFWVTALGLIKSFVFPKIMTIDAYADYHTFALYVSYLSVLTLGLPTGMVINYAGKDYKKIDKSIYKSEIYLLFGILFVASLIGLAGACYTWETMLFFVTWAIIPTCTINSYKSLYQAWGQFGSYTKINALIPTCITTIALGVFAVFGELTGEQYILVYLFVYTAVLVWLMSRLGLELHGVKRAALLSVNNKKTLQSGFILMIGNYVNILFHSIDQQYIKLFYDTKDFAMYSFGMSMQSIMTVFITSISQPLFPRMAQGDLKDAEYKKMKEILFVFGSLSGCAYFACSFIVKLFIPHYIGSLNVIGIFFAVFPAMAVINCLYINLYKIQKMTTLYVKTLVKILAVAFSLNLLAVLLRGDYYSIAIATTITYYIWLLYGGKHFPSLRLTLKDGLYLMLYLIVFFTTTKIQNIYLGMGIYTGIIVVLAMLFYKECIMSYLKRIRK